MPKPKTTETAENNGAGVAAGKPQDDERDLIKHKETFSIEKNAFVADDETGTLNFPMGQVVSDDTTQRSGTHYDMESMDISEYNGTVTADHIDMLQSIVAKTKLFKRANQVVMNAVQFAVKENPLAQLAYDLYKGGYAKDFSIETYGPWPDETGLMVNSKLVGLSCVVTGNNKSATINSLVRNSLATARNNGLDTAEVEKALGVEPEATGPQAQSVTTNKQEEDMKYVTVKNGRDFAIKVTYKNAAGDDVEKELAPGDTVDVSDDQQEPVEKQLGDAKAPDTDKPAVDVNALTEAIGKAIDQRFESFEKTMLDKTAQEPQFQTGKPKDGPIRNKNGDQELAAMDWEDRTVRQIESARLFLTNQDLDGLQELNRINKYHLNELKEKGVVKNAVDLSGFGNFVTSPELLTTIEGVRNDYSPLVDAVGFRETLSLKMAWLERSGDIAMQEVGFSESDNPDNLKPISQYTTTPRDADLKEVAAVTPVSNAATRFLAVDLLTDVAEGYRTSYQRILAESVLARLQQAVNFTGNSTPLTLDTAVDGLISIVNAIKRIANITANGTFIFNTSTELELFSLQMRANLTGDTLGLFAKGPDGNMRFVGRPFIVVPDDTMPAINTGATKTVVIDGTNVTIDQGIFYADLTTVSGRVSGGLNYTLSTEAAYEQDGVVKSAFQRDELLLRGFFYRNAAVRNRAKVSGVHAGGVS